MRYFDRSSMKRPAVFESDYFRRAQAELDVYIRDSDGLSRQKRAPYDAKLLKDSEIEQAFITGFGRFCAYCETDMSQFDFFDIEHHRPKSGAADRHGKTDFQYYTWLVYDWENLLPVCRTCNVAKKNKFFVANIRGAVGASIAQLRETEIELQIDPCRHNIAEHLLFDPSGLARAQSEVGQGTIDILELNRTSLVRERAHEFGTIIGVLAQTEKLGVMPTGLPAGWSSSVMAWPDGRAIPHAGAATLAILDFASAQSMGKLANFADFLARWADLDVGERAKFCKAFEHESASKSTQAAIPSAQYRAPPRRNLRLRDIPTAERPISGVRIRNFKALPAIDLKLTPALENSDMVPCMLLLGENATGKSSVLEAICLALLGTAETQVLDRLVSDGAIQPAEFLHRPNLENWNVVAAAPLSVEVDFLGQEHPTRLEGGNGDTTFGGTELPSQIVIGYGPRRYFPKKQARRFRSLAYRAHSLFDPMAAITSPVAWLLSLGHTDPLKFDAAVRALRVVLMLGSDAAVVAENKHIMIESAGRRTPLAKMSVGYKSVLAMVTDIIRVLFTYYDNLENAHACVLIDEIETHLHPRWKMQIVELLRQAFPKVQFIFTTHDPLCLRGMYKGEVFVLRRRQIGGGIETLSDLPDARGMRAEQILTSEFFGLGSTDPSTDAKVERYQQLATKSERSPVEEAERRRLAEEIEQQMMVGLTLVEQTQAEAARQADLDKAPPPNKIQDGERKRMIEEALRKLRPGRAAR